MKTEYGLRPAGSANETTAGRFARTYPDLGTRELGAIVSEAYDFGAAFSYRAEDSEDAAWSAYAEAVLEDRARAPLG